MSDLGIWGKKHPYLSKEDAPVALEQDMTANIPGLGASSGYFLHIQGTTPAHKREARALQQYAVRQENKKPRVQMVCAYVDVSSAL